MIAENIQKIKNTLPEGVTLVAVSKTKPNEMIQEGYDAGHLDYGENKVQDLVAKYEALPKDIRWHFIGHLQTNKVKYMAPFVHLLHGIDSMKLLKTVNKEAIKNKRTIDCLLQVKIAEEESKFGLSKKNVLEMIDNEEFKALENIRIRGLMGMSTNTEDEVQVKLEFSSLKTFFDELKSSVFTDASFDTLSMGMSNDYPLAVECGSTMVRVGSSIFGARNYS